MSPTTETRICSFDQLLGYCKHDRRSMIRCAVRIPYMPKYKHHYILLGHTWSPYFNSFLIIHYSTEIQGGKIVEQSYTRGQIEADIMKGLYVLNDSRYPQTEDEFDKAYDRFEERKGEQAFNISTNNCEHFANYVMTGRAFSDQIEGLELTQKLLAFTFGSSGGSSGSSSSCSGVSGILSPSSSSGMSQSYSSSCSGRNFLPPSLSGFKCGRYLQDR